MKSISLLLSSLCVTTLSAQDSKLSSSAIAEAVEQLMSHRAHMTSEIRLLAGAYLNGPAVTIRLVRDEKASATQAGLTAIQLLEAAAAGSVVVATLDDDKSFAIFGSTFAALAKARHLAGFVVDGSVRDLSDLKRFKFATFARGGAPGSAGGHYRIEGTNVPVECGGISVRPGDYVFGDGDGIAVAPKERYAEIVIAAKAFQSEKQALLPLIQQDASYLKVLQQRDAARRKQ